MSTTQKRCNDRVIQLAEGINVRTSLPSDYIPALRSGFALYPFNPRWNAMKFGAWKTGRQWRQALSQGQMIVRSADSMLVEASESTATTEPAPTSKKPRRFVIDQSWLPIKRNSRGVIVISPSLS